MTLADGIQKSFPIQKLLRMKAAERARNFALRNPVSSQREIFFDLVTKAAETRFGRENDFRSLSELPFDSACRKFRSGIPLRNYREFAADCFCHGLPHDSACRNPPFLDNVTWPGVVRMFCETSGTTAPSKFIPFTSQMFAENRRAALDMISCYLSSFPESTLPTGKILYMSGSTRLTEVRSGVWSGDMSALTLRFRPWYISPFVEPNIAVSDLPWEEKLQAMAELLLSDRRIRAISGVPPWIILLLKRCIDIGRKPLSLLLPELELIVHGGTSLKPYRNELENLFEGKVPRLLELLPSSEAFMAFQMVGEEHMRLTPYYGVFFEFVRFDDLDANGKPLPHAETLLLEQVETGVRYAIVISSCSGLWRYHIGDTIRFVSTDPHLIEFCGRDRVLDRFEEKVTQDEVEQAVADLNRDGGWNVREFMAGADIRNRRHIWVLAMKNGDQQSDDPSGILDAALCGMNADYSTFRRQGRITPPCVIIVSEDEIYRWSSEERGKLGGQSKIPHIDPTEDSSMIASLVNFCSSGQPG